MKLTKDIGSETCTLPLARHELQHFFEMNVEKIMKLSAVNLFLTAFACFSRKARGTHTSESSNGAGALSIIGTGHELAEIDLCKYIKGLQ